MRRVCLNSVYELARKDSRVVFIGSDLGAGTLETMRDEMPERFFMEGICEQNIIGMAAGLALEGYIPYVNTIATFLTRRCYEQVAIDIGLHNLPVRLIGNGGGVVYAPLGPTHLATDDISLMRAIPNMGVVAPSDAEEMGRFMPQTLSWDGPLYIRLAKGGDPIVSDDKNGFSIGKGIVLREPGNILLVATGTTVAPCIEAAEALSADGISCGIVHFPTVKPLDSDTLRTLARKCSLVVTVEEHSLIGGLGSAVLEVLADGAESRMPSICRLGIAEEFPEKYGSQKELMEHYGLCASHIVHVVRKQVGRK